MLNRCETALDNRRNDRTERRGLDIQCPLAGEIGFLHTSVSTRVVSWNDAAEMNESVESDAFVMPSSSGRPVAGRPPASIGPHVM